MLAGVACGQEGDVPVGVQVDVFGGDDWAAFDQDAACVGCGWSGCAVGIGFGVPGRHVHTVGAHAGAHLGVGFGDGALGGGAAAIRVGRSLGQGAGGAVVQLTMNGLRNLAK